HCLLCKNVTGYFLFSKEYVPFHTKHAFYNYVAPLGLKSMKERIQLMKGSFQIITELKKGTKIEIQLPI
ncbi:hypothetical protein ACT4US_32810, partial [Bacillus sp. HC-Mk]